MDPSYQRTIAQLKFVGLSDIAWFDNSGGVATPLQ